MRWVSSFYLCTFSVLRLAFPDDDEVLPADERLENWHWDFSTARLFIVCVSRMPQMPSTHGPVFETLPRLEEGQMQK